MSRFVLGFLAAAGLAFLSNPFMPPVFYLLVLAVVYWALRPKPR